MKVVINTCFGGFSLSPRGIKRWAELKGRECFFFGTGRGLDGHLDLNKRVPLTLEQAEEQGLFWNAFDIPNPDEVLADGDWHSLTQAQREQQNALYKAHDLSSRDIPRHDPDLVRVVEELGGDHREGASGACAELRVVEIPDGTDYEIDEYDGNEHIAEKHRTWR